MYILRNLWRRLSGLKADGGIFVFNPAPFEISDYIELDEIQYYADKDQAHGGKVISACEVASDVTVTKKVLEKREVIVLVKNFEIVTSNFVR